MDLLKGILLIWLVWGGSMLLMNTKDLSLLAASKLKVTRAWQSVLYFPLWLLMCIMLIIVYPPITIKNYARNIYNTLNSQK